MGRVRESPEITGREGSSSLSCVDGLSLNITPPMYVLAKLPKAPSLEKCPRMPLSPGQCAAAAGPRRQPALCAPP